MKIFSREELLNRIKITSSEQVRLSDDVVLRITGSSGEDIAADVTDSEGKTETAYLWDHHKNTDRFYFPSNTDAGDVKTNLGEYKNTDTKYRTHYELLEAALEGLSPEPDIKGAEPGSTDAVPSPTACLEDYYRGKAEAYQHIFDSHTRIKLGK